MGLLSIKAVAWEGYKVNGVTLQQCGTGDAAGLNEKNEAVKSVEKAKITNVAELHACSLLITV